MTADLASLLTDARQQLDDAIAEYENADGCDDAEERQEALDDAAIALVLAITDITAAFDILREEGAQVEPAPRDQEARWLAVQNFGLVSERAVATVQMVADRLRR